MHSSWMCTFRCSSHTVGAGTVCLGCEQNVLPRGGVCLGGWCTLPQRGSSA